MKRITIIFMMMIVSGISQGNNPEINLKENPHAILLERNEDILSVLFQKEEITMSIFGPGFPEQIKTFAGTLITLSPNAGMPIKPNWHRNECYCFWTQDGEDVNWVAGTPFPYWKYVWIINTAENGLLRVTFIGPEKATVERINLIIKKEQPLCGGSLILPTSLKTHLLKTPK